jgi:tight adherence protein B
MNRGGVNGRGLKRRRRADADPPIEEVAQVTQRLAVLLSAGVSPVSAWGYLLPPDSAGLPRGPGNAPADPRDDPLADSRDDPPTTRVIRAAAGAGRRGDSIADAVADEARALGGQVGDAWLGLAAAWEVATQAGAPLAGCLRELAGSFRELGQVHRDLTVALAGPAATARMVMALPVVGILFGSLMGFNTLQTLFLTVPGVICLVAGAALMLAGSRWNRRLVRAARARDPTPGLQLDLTAIGMAGGGSVDRARALVRSAVERFGLDRPDWPDPAHQPGADGSDSNAAITRVLDLSGRAGVPAAELLRSEADQLRRDVRSEGQRRAATLSVTLMIPLGVCVLPAFMLVGVAPLLLSVLSSTLTTF